MAAGLLVVLGAGLAAGQRAPVALLELADHNAQTAFPARPLVVGTTTPIRARPR